MLRVTLNPGLAGGNWACLRPLCGHDEAAADGTEPVDACGLLDRLLVDAPGTAVGPGRARELAVSDGDRLYAALYLHYFGERIEGTVACRQCGQPFELTFSLRELMASLEAGAAERATGPDGEGLYTLSDGRRFRLPTLADQHEMMGVRAGAAAAALLERCVVEGDPLKDPASVQAAMEEVGALLDLELEAACSECGRSQVVHFDIQSYLMRALAHERRFLRHEAHRIALAYGWGHGEILDLTREDRRAFVRLIEAERAAGRRMRAWATT